MDDVVQDLKVNLKLLKRILKDCEKRSHQIKKLDEYNKMTSKMLGIEHSINLLDACIWFLSEKQKIDLND